MRKILLTNLLFLIIAQVFAQLTVPTFFSDHMVLQREKPIPIWGTAKLGEKINVQLGLQKATVKTDEDGKWKVGLKAMQAGGPYRLTVKSSKEELTFDDVFIGEVWICSGQSNMEFRVRSAMDAMSEIAEPNYPEIRSFNVVQEMAHTPKSNLKGKWEVCSPTTVSDFSTVGYFFAKELYQKLHIPIGFINTSWGGTDIETWISMDVMDGFPKYEKLLSRMRSTEFETYVKYSEKVKKEFEQAMIDEQGEPQRWFAVNTKTDDWQQHSVPGLWSNPELSPIDGVVWFSYEFSLPADCLRQDAELSLGP